MCLVFAQDAEATVVRDIGIFLTATGATDVVPHIRTAPGHVAQKAVINPDAAGTKAMCAVSKTDRYCGVYRPLEGATMRIWRCAWELFLKRENI